MHNIQMKTKEKCIRTEKMNTPFNHASSKSFAFFHHAIMYFLVNLLLVTVQLCNQVCITCWFLVVSQPCIHMHALQTLS